MNKMIRCCITVTLLSLFTLSAAQADPAEEAVLAWLEAIDSGEYELAWAEASPILQRPLSASMLERTIGLARHEFGAVESRRRTRVISETSMPGAPSGDYKEFTYQTRFQDKTSITETVTPHFEQGTWRVSGYYVTSASR